TGTSRTSISVAIPNVPSLPTNRPTRSYPTVSPAPPSSTTRPSGSTTVSPVTWFNVTPYFRQCGPPAFSATFPPIVQAACELGSGAYVSPYGAAARLNRTFTTPGSTRARRFAASIDRIRSIRARDTTTAPSRASAPPDNPVPAPRATNGTPARSSTRSTAETSAVPRGRTTARGRHRYAVSPSDS